MRHRAQAGHLALPTLGRRACLAILGLLLSQPRAVLAQGIDDTQRAVIRALIDRLLPASPSQPGAIALGVAADTLRAFEASKGGRLRLRLMVQELHGAAFLQLTAVEKDRRISELLAPTNRTSGLCQTILDYVVRSYFVKPGSWVALGYRTPQPSGYSDFAQCDTKQVPTDAK